MENKFPTKLCPAGMKDFNILQELGAGGFSIVYLARHFKNNNKYAIKVLTKKKKHKKDKVYKSGNSFRRSRREKVLKEIEILKGLKHPNIIRLYDWFEGNEDICIVMEYLNGTDMRKYFHREIPTLKDAQYVVKQIVSGLKYCHDNDYIHRDIKPENILISKNLKVKITDFGLCLKKDIPDQKFINYGGTPSYMSPEQIKGKYYDQSVDSWALGVTIYTLLTGSKMFCGENTEDLFNKIKKHRSSFKLYFKEYIDKLCPEEVDMIYRLTRSDPDKRISMETLESHPWFSLYKKIPMGKYKYIRKCLNTDKRIDLKHLLERCYLR